MSIYAWLTKKPDKYSNHESDMITCSNAMYTGSCPKIIDGFI